MLKKTEIEPSLLAFYQTKDLKEKLVQLKELGIKRIHYDVMDAQYVPNFSFYDEYLTILQELGFEIEVHLMVQNVKTAFNFFLKQKNVKSIIFHPSVLHCHEILELFLTSFDDIDIGLAFNLDENPQDYDSILFLTKNNLIMGVWAGAGGQKFQNISLNNLKTLKQSKKNLHLKTTIVFDGGVNNKTVYLVNKDCDYLVSGSYLMQADNKKEALKKLLWIK